MVTNDFNLDVDEILETALEPLGGEWTSGDEASRARRLLNLILIKLQNKNIPLSTLKFETVILKENKRKYPLSKDINNVLEANFKNSLTSIETPIKRYGVKEYQRIPNKDQKGRPLGYYIERDSENSFIYVWQVPSQQHSSSTIELLVSKKLEGVEQAVEKVNIDTLYLPLIVDWLSYELSLRRSNIDPNTRMELKQKYEEARMDAFDEDRERADFKITPKVW